MSHEEHIGRPPIELQLESETATRLWFSTLITTMLAQTSSFNSEKSLEDHLKRVLKKIAPVAGGTIYANSAEVSTEDIKDALVPIHNTHDADVRNFMQIVEDCDLLNSLAEHVGPGDTESDSSRSSGENETDDEDAGRMSTSMSLSEGSRIDLLYKLTMLIPAETHINNLDSKKVDRRTLFTVPVAIPCRDFISGKPAGNVEANEKRWVSVGEHVPCRLSNHVQNLIPKLLALDWEPDNVDETRTSLPQYYYKDEDNEDVYMHEAQERADTFVFTNNNVDQPINKILHEANKAVIITEIEPSDEGNDQFEYNSKDSVLKLGPELSRTIFKNRFFRRYQNANGLEITEPGIFIHYSYEDPESGEIVSFGQVGVLWKYDAVAYALHNLDTDHVCFHFGTLQDYDASRMDNDQILAPMRGRTTYKTRGAFDRPGMLMITLFNVSFRHDLKDGEKLGFI